jgi:hypothetical protein
VKFNINDTVRVRLTDYGRAVLRDDWQSTTNIYYARPEQRAIRGEYKPPKEDEHGWSEWQLWALMEAFGERCRLSFETEIEIVGAEVVNAEAERDEANRDRELRERLVCAFLAGFNGNPSYNTHAASIPQWAINQADLMLAAMRKKVTP